MLSEPGLWLMITGALLVTPGFFGFAFNQNRQAFDSSNGEQQGSTPIDLPNPLFNRHTKNEVSGPARRV
jgi:hypothetical protein